MKEQTFISVATLNSFWYCHSISCMRAHRCQQRHSNTAMSNKPRNNQTVQCRWKKKAKMYTSRAMSWATWQTTMRSFVPILPACKREYKMSGQILLKQQNNYHSTGTSRTPALVFCYKQNKHAAISGFFNEVAVHIKVETQEKNVSTGLVQPCRAIIWRCPSDFLFTFSAVQTNFRCLHFNGTKSVHLHLPHR